MEKKYLSREKIIGKQVIDSNAILVGNVKDLSFDLNSKNIALAVTVKSGQEITIEGNNVTVVGDVILLNKPVELSKPSPEVPAPIKPQEVAPAPQVVSQPSTTPGLCSVCGFQNDPNAKFCIKCGSKLK